MDYDMSLDGLRLNSSLKNGLCKDCEKLSPNTSFVLHEVICWVLISMTLSQVIFLIKNKMKISKKKLLYWFRKSYLQIKNLLSLVDKDR